MRPIDENSEVDESFFNILVMHQNRYKGTFSYSTRNSITDETLPRWLDLVVWGHEHECQTELRTIESTGGRILQPGSSVATSLIEAEAKLKHSFRLMVNEQKMHLEPIKLQT